MAKRHAWELIEREYRTGRFSLAQLEARHGVNRSNISRRAKKYGWQKDLTERVRERTQEKITRASLSPEAQVAYDQDDEQVVEQAASENAAVAKPWSAGGALLSVMPSGWKASWQNARSRLNCLLA